MLKPSCKVGRTGFKPGTRTGTNGSFNPVSNQPALKNDVRGNDDSCSAAPTGIEPATLVQDMMELFREINNWSVLMPFKRIRSQKIKGKAPLTGLEHDNNSVLTVATVPPCGSLDAC